MKKVTLREFCEKYLPTVFCNPWGTDRLALLEFYQGEIDCKPFMAAEPQLNRGRGTTSIKAAALIWRAIFTSALAVEQIDTLEGARWYAELIHSWRMSPAMRPLRLRYIVGIEQARRGSIFVVVKPITPDDVRRGKHKFCPRCGEPMHRLMGSTKNRERKREGCAYWHCKCRHIEKA